MLGLKIEKESDGEVLYASGDSRLSVYVGGSAGTNKSTYACWEVADVTNIAEKLKIAGVTFEHYDDMAGVTREGDIHTMGTTQVAWFKDPDGNFLCIANDLN